MTQLRNTPHAARDGGLAVVLWLFAALLAEVEFFLYLFERAYS